MHHHARSGATVHRSTLAELLATTEPAYGGSWYGAITGLLADPYEAATIARLRRHLRRHGSFRQPPVIVDGTVANGMHRIAAAVTSGATSIDWVDRYPDTDDPGAGWWEVTFDLDGVDGRDPLDVAVGALRSFEDGGRWYEADGFGATRGRLHTDWSAHEHPDIDELTAALGRQAQRWGLTLTVVDVTHEPDD